MSDDDFTLSDVEGWGSELGCDSDEDFVEDNVAYIAQRRKIAAATAAIQKELNARQIEREQVLLREQLLEEGEDIVTMGHLKAEQLLMQKKQHYMEEERRFESLKNNVVGRWKKSEVVQDERYQRPAWIDEGDEIWKEPEHPLVGKNYAENIIIK